jgi:hypothetical protein
MMPAMATPLKKPRQFRLRSLLAGITWFALILAVCVNHQHAATNYRLSLEARRMERMIAGCRIQCGSPQPSTANSSSALRHNP